MKVDFKSIPRNQKSSNFGLDFAEKSRFEVERNFQALKIVILGEN